MTFEKANNNLKECPFCGGKVTVQDRFEDEQVAIVCYKCGARMYQAYLAEKSAVEEIFDRWNRRV